MTTTPRELLLKIIESPRGHPVEMTVDERTHTSLSWLAENGWISDATGVVWMATVKALDSAPDFMEDLVLADPEIVREQADQQEQMEAAFGKMEGMTSEQESVALFLFHIHKEIPYKVIFDAIRRSRPTMSGGRITPKGPEWVFACEMYRELTGG